MSNAQKLSQAVAGGQTAVRNNLAASWTALRDMGVMPEAEYPYDHTRLFVRPSDTEIARRNEKSHRMGRSIRWYVRSSGGWIAVSVVSRSAGAGR